MDVCRRGALVATLLTFAALPARAEEDERPAPAAKPHVQRSTEPVPSSTERARPSTGRRVLAGAAAVVPGVVVRGAGHYVAGDRRTAKRLLLIEGAGLVLAAAGGIPIGVSGAAGETMPGLALLLPGSALLFTSVAADFWGAAGGASLAGEPLMPDALSLSAGYTAVLDPRLPFTNLATLGVDARRGRGLAAASTWYGDGAWRAALTGGVRLFGPRPGERRADASSFDGVVTVAEERRDAGGYAITAGDVGVRGRLDLVRLAPSLRGSHVRGGIGLGAERIRYHATDVADLSGLITAHFAWGFTLGDGGPRALEAELYYEHRRDTLAGGVTLPTPGNGFVGYFGATATAWRDRWGLTTTAEVGSAWVLSLAARMRITELP